MSEKTKKRIKNVIVISATVVTAAVVYELALIGTRAVAEDVGYLNAVRKTKFGSSKKKGGKRRGRR